MAIPEKTNPNETPDETFHRWLTDGETTILCFENQDLGHPDVGRRITLPYDDTVAERATIDKTTAPDQRTIGLGWRYILKAKTKDVATALRWLAHTSDGTVQ